MNDSQNMRRDAIVRALSADRRIEAAWLSGSLGKGSGGARWPASFEEAARRHFAAALGVDA